MKEIKLIWKKKNIASVATKITWSGQNTEVCRQLTFEVANNPFSKEYKAPSIQTGDIVTFYYNKKVRFVGRVFNAEKKTEVGTVEFTAFDFLYNLIHSEATYKFKNRTPEFIAKKICKDFKIAYGSIARTKHKIKKYIPSGMTLYAIITKAYQKAEKSTKKKYVIRMYGKKLEVVRRGTVNKSFTLDTSQNVISTSWQKDATGVVNKVAVYNSKGKTIGTYSSKSSVKKYGIIQGAINVDKGKGKKQAKSALKNAEVTVTIDVIGDIRCISAYGVEVKDKYTGLKGVYYIKSDSHVFENGQYSMTLDLTKKNSDESIEYSKIDENAAKTTNEDGSVTTVKKHTYKAIFTAYSENTGSKKDAQGHKLNAARRTCAMGKRFKFGTKIECECKGTVIDGKTYRVTDRPKNQKLKKRWHVDILMKTDAECRKFGVRNGKITIYTTTTTGGKISGKGDKKGKEIAEKALSKRGCWYKWGEQGPDRFDCSGLVWWAHKQCGIHFARGNAAGLMEYGSKISYSNLQVGDVILYSSNGKASGIHHTGIYIGGGEMVHAPHSGAKVTTVTVASGYYRQQFYCARRIR